MNTVLLIEDNVELLDNTSEILELANYNVIKAENGKEGLEKIKEFKEDISIILCDIVMPVMDGFSVLQAIDNISELKKIPFIFLTGKSENKEIRKGMNLGADDYLTKPFSADDLLGLITTRLKKNLELKEILDPVNNGFESLLTKENPINADQILKNNARTKRLKRKETLYMEGDETIHVYYIISGKLKTVKTNDFGKEFIGNIFKEGDFIGYNSLLENGMHEESAIAMEDSQVALLDKHYFFELLLTNKTFYANFLKHLVSSLNNAESKLPKIAYYSARKKVAEALLFIADKYCNPGQEPLKFSVTRDDLSAVSGIAPESVSRNLTDFKNEQLIDMQDGKYVILNFKKLQTLRN
jgi:CRP-like cAMP-binding protein